jgi:SAM-dependent methyltransferase
MPLSIQDWHQRYIQQASWTKDLRDHLYKKARIQEVARVLDVGSGTGALEREIVGRTQASVYSLDIDSASLKFLSSLEFKTILTQGDAHQLPYGSDVFDICLCHFVLLWVKDPGAVVAEMRRVTHPDGFVLALAEPDYEGRIDYPPELTQIGAWQRESLRLQGADHEMGRKLAGIFARAGLIQIETGVLGGQWVIPPAKEALASEWSVIQSDLLNLAAPPQDWQYLEILKQKDASAWQTGIRVLYVPTFYAIGTVPAE